MNTSRSRPRTLRFAVAGIAATAWLSAGLAGPALADAGNGNGSSASATDTSQPQPQSNADSNPGGANNDGDCGSYCSTRDGSPSQNGNGNGNAEGKPCAGCVGKADNKNPPGQQPDGSDANNGYECDANHGIGRSNPAHTGCTTATTAGTTPATTPDTGTTPTVGSTANAGSTPSGGATAGAATPPTSVLGVAHQRQPASSLPTQVLGEKFARNPASGGQSSLPAGVAPNALPFTGSDLLPALGGAGLLLLLGAGALVVGRRRRVGSAALTH